MWLYHPGHFCALIFMLLLFHYMLEFKKYLLKTRMWLQYDFMAHGMCYLHFGDGVRNSRRNGQITVMGFAYTVGPFLFLYKWSLTKNHAALILSSTQNSVLRMKLSTFTKWIFDKNMEQETIVRLERSSLVLTHYSESWALGCPVWATHWRYYCDPGHLVFTSRDLTIFFYHGDTFIKTQILGTTQEQHTIYYVRWY